VAVAAFALTSGWVMPRGPVTSAQALATMAISLAVGAVVGAATGSRRWCFAIAPIGYVALFELARIGAWGPTVDLLTANTLVAWAAFLLGRLLHGVVAIAPMMLGGLVGAELKTRSDRSIRPLGPGGWALTVTLALALTAVGVAIARPPTTAPILGPTARRCWAASPSSPRLPSVATSRRC
jgi:proline iminopeptidase